MKIGPDFLNEFESEELERFAHDLILRGDHQMAEQIYLHTESKGLDLAREEQIHPRLNYFTIKTERIFREGLEARKQKNDLPFILGLAAQVRYRRAISGLRSVRAELRERNQYRRGPPSLRTDIESKHSPLPVLERRVERMLADLQGDLPKYLARDQSPATD